MAVVVDVARLGAELERSYPVRVRGQLKFRVGQLVYVARADACKSPTS